MAEGIGIIERRSNVAPIDLGAPAVLAAFNKWEVSMSEPEQEVPEPPVQIPDYDKNDTEVPFGVGDLEIAEINAGYPDSDPDQQGGDAQITEGEGLPPGGGRPDERDGQTN